MLAGLKLPEAICLCLLSAGIKGVRASGEALGPMGLSDNCLLSSAGSLRLWGGQCHHLALCPLCFSILSQLLGDTGSILIKTIWGL